MDHLATWSKVLAIRYRYVTVWKRGRVHDWTKRHVDGDVDRWACRWTASPPPSCRWGSSATRWSSRAGTRSASRRRAPCAGAATCSVASGCPTRSTPAGWRRRCRSTPPSSSSPRRPKRRPATTSTPSPFRSVHLLFFFFLAHVLVAECISSSFTLVPVEVFRFHLIPTLFNLTKSKRNLT